MLPFNRNRPFMFLHRRGQLVRVAQEALNHRKCYVGENALKVDGYYGHQTESGVILFQRDKGFKETGCLTYDEYDALIGIGTLSLITRPNRSDLREDQSASKQDYFALHRITSWVNGVLQSSPTKIGLSAFLVLSMVFGVTKVMPEGYTIKVFIADLAEIFVASPSEESGE